MIPRTTFPVFVALIISVASGSTGSAQEQPSPKEAWEGFRKAVAANDGEGIWAYLSNDSRDLLVSDGDGKIKTLRTLPDGVLRQLADGAGIETSPFVLRMLPVENLAKIIMLGEARKNKDKILGSKWEGVALDGDSAVITVTLPDGTEKVSVLVKEEGTWRLNGPATHKARHP